MASMDQVPLGEGAPSAATGLGPASAPGAVSAGSLQGVNTDTFLSAASAATDLIGNS